MIWNTPSSVRRAVTLLMAKSRGGFSEVATFTDGLLSYKVKIILINFSLQFIIYVLIKPPQPHQEYSKHLTDNIWG